MCYNNKYNSITKFVDVRKKHSHIGEAMAENRAQHPEWSRDEARPINRRLLKQDEYRSPCRSGSELPNFHLTLLLVHTQQSGILSDRHHQGMVCSGSNASKCMKPMPVTLR